MVYYTITENGKVIEMTPMASEEALKKLKEEWENSSNEEILDEFDGESFGYANKYGEPVIHQIVDIDRKYRGNPYIVRVAYYVVDPEDFKRIIDAVDEEITEYSYRELHNGEGYYLEFESNLIEKDIPVIGSPKKVAADIIQVWGD